MSGYTYFIKEKNEYREVTQEEFLQYKQAVKYEREVYVIRLGSAVMEVTHEDYLDFYTEKRRQRYLLEESIKHEEFSYDAMDTEDLLGEALLEDKSVSVEAEVIRNIYLERVAKCLETLSNEEYQLLQELFYEEKSERELSAYYGVSQPAIHKRKNKILRKLKKILEN